MTLDSIRFRRDAPLRGTAGGQVLYSILVDGADFGSVVRSRDAGVWRLAARLHRSPDAGEIVIEDAPQRCAWNRLQVLLHTLLDTDEEDADGRSFRAGSSAFSPTSRTANARSSTRTAGSCSPPWSRATRSDSTAPTGNSWGATATKTGSGTDASNRRSSNCDWREWTLLPRGTPRTRWNAVRGKIAVQPSGSAGGRHHPGHSGPGDRARTGPALGRSAGHHRGHRDP